MNLIEALQPKETGKIMISAVGAGGKTTCLNALKDYFVEQNKSVVITTTTHMYLPAHHFVLDEDIEAMKGALAQDGFVIAGTKADSKKMKGVSEQCFRKLLDISDVVLVEADGSKRLPLKMPASFEPVIPEAGSKVIVIAGVDSIGRPLEEVCHRFELAGKVLGVAQNHLVSEKDVARLIYKGYLERRNPSQDYVVFINKVENKVQKQQAALVLKYIAEMDETKSIGLSSGSLFLKDEGNKE